MKYIRKITALIIAVVLIAAVSIGIGVIFAVKNVNVTLYSCTCEADSEEATAKISELKTDILSEVRGKIISSVGGENISSAVKDKNYNVVGFEKVYPCTINVTIKERRELFYTVSDAGGVYVYDVYDDDGSVMRIAESEAEAVNPDGVPNLLVESADGVDLLQFSDKVAAVCAAFENTFGPLRSVCEKAVITFGLDDNFCFQLRCGVKVIVYKFSELTEEKISAAYGCFNALSGGKKISGEIHCYETDDKTVSASYR